MGTYLKFVNCTHGQSIKFLVRPGTYASLRRCVGDRPSRYAIEVRKRAMFVGAKMNWSHATRARMVLFVEERLTFLTRKEYHFVAAGPKIAGWGVGVSLWYFSAALVGYE